MSEDSVGAAAHRQRGRLRPDGGREPRHPAGPPRGPGDEHDRPGEPAGAAGARRHRQRVARPRSRSPLQPDAGGVPCRRRRRSPRSSTPRDGSGVTSRSSRSGRAPTTCGASAKPRSRRSRAASAAARRTSTATTTPTGCRGSWTRSSTWSWPRDCPAPQSGRGISRRPAAPRHRHDGLVRRRRRNPSLTGRPSACWTSSPRCRSALTELMCHPGVFDETLAYSRYGRQREVELSALCDPEARATVERLDIRLCHFGALAAGG